MSAVGPLALSPREAAAYFAFSKRTLSRLIRAKKIAPRKGGLRTLVDVASLKRFIIAAENRSRAIVFGRRAHVVPRSRRTVRVH